MSDLGLATKLTEAFLGNMDPEAWLTAARATPDLPWATALESAQVNVPGLGSDWWTEDRKLQLLEQL